MKDSGHILKEASLIKNLKHPHIPIIYDIYEDDISICIIEEYISGKSLRNYIYDEKSLKLNQICDIGVKLCNILEYLHNYQDGIIHLDIKPDNIIIDENNNVKLIDFGNALYGDESQQLSMLSPGYAAPEQYDNRQLTRSADIYSVGMILMFMVEAAVRKNDNSGHNVCQNTGDLSAIRHNKLYPIIRKCTRHKPQSRYKNITAVRRELERAAGWAALKANKQKQSDSYRHSYVIKISGTKRGIGVTHTALSMAYMLAEYGIKCILYEQSGNSDILEVMLNGKLYDNGLLYYKGVWFAADNVSYKMYGSDDTDNVNYKQNNDGNFDSMNFNVMIVDEGVYNAERVSYDDIICSFIQNDYDIIDKPGTKIPIDSNLHVKGNIMPYVSRGGLKLERALKEFELDITDRIMVDIGSSTGGFTDCALQNGVKLVYAIDVGTNQLVWKLRNDPRVIVKEQTNDIIILHNISNCPCGIKATMTKAKTSIQ